MASCKFCLLYDICEKKGEEVCKGTRVQDLEHECIDFLKRVELSEDELNELADKFIKIGCTSFRLTPEEIRELIKNGKITSDKEETKNR